MSGAAELCTYIKVHYYACRINVHMHMTACSCSIAYVTANSMMHTHTPCSIPHSTLPSPYHTLTLSLHTTLYPPYSVPHTFLSQLCKNRPQTPQSPHHIPYSSHPLHALPTGQFYSLDYTGLPSSSPDPAARVSQGNSGLRGSLSFMELWP